MSRLLMSVNKNGVVINVKISKHAYRRFKERLEPIGIDTYCVACDVLKIGDRLIKHANNEISISIQDYENGFTTICNVYYYKQEICVKIITLVDKANSFAKHGTQVEVIG